jgi:hypothetical protein
MLLVAQPAPPPARLLDDKDERLDWDQWLPTPPPRPCGQVVARLVAGGRSQPLPVAAPAEDAPSS